jgi:hypothetical protein
MTKATTTSAEWRETLDDLAKRKATAEADLQIAKRAAAEAALAGDGASEAREVQHHRDRVAALGEATQEGERRLAAALEAEDAQRCAAEMTHARKALTARALAAVDLDTALAAAGAAFATFTAASELAGQHLTAAGRPPSHQKMTGRPFMPGALFAASPELATALHLSRPDSSLRQPLAGIVAAQNLSWSQKHE